MIKPTLLAFATVMLLDVSSAFAKGGFRFSPVHARHVIHRQVKVCRNLNCYVVLQSYDEYTPALEHDVPREHDGPTEHPQ